jgi:hypothetical protein
LNKFSPFHQAIEDSIESIISLKKLGSGKRHGINGKQKNQQRKKKEKKNPSPSIQPTFCECSGPKEFVPFEVLKIGEVNVIGGFQICSELWFTEHSRVYGQQGCHILLAPRATGRQSVPKWIVGGCKVEKRTSLQELTQSSLFVFVFLFFWLL